MRLNKIIQLNYRSFKNFQWDNQTCQFKDINIIFGYNGSGKTNLSQFLNFLTSEDENDKDRKFQLDTNKGSISNKTRSLNLSNAIKVFNKSYVKSVLKNDQEIPYIVYIGKEGVNYLNKEEELKSKQEEIKRIIPVNDKHNTIATNAAKSIKEITGINSIAKEYSKDTFSGYNKTDFEKRINKFEEEIENNKADELDVVKKYLLDFEALEEAKRHLINSEQLAKSRELINDVIKWVQCRGEDISSLFTENPSSQELSRIKNLQPKEEQWVREGVDIHLTSKKHKKCLFCDSNIINGEELLLHFSEEIRNLITKLDYLKTKISEFKKQLENLSDTNMDQKQKGIVPKLKKNLETLGEMIKTKKLNINTTLEPINYLDNEVLKYFNDSNNETKEDDGQIYAIKIECHYVAEVFKKYLEEKNNYDEYIKQKSQLDSELETLKQAVAQLKSKASNTHEAANIFNKAFATTFPYRKIQISNNDENTGYRLTRDGKNCDLNSLSEGEYNFLALLYFLISLDDEDGVKKLEDDALIVIDDPVSSLDKNSIFQIYSQIINRIDGNSHKRQYIIMTHSSDFLNHLLERYNGSKKEVSYYNMTLSSENKSKIENMNQLLLKHRSDYYYIFYLLKQKNEFWSSEEDGYLVINLLRRWLETFLNFQFSHGDNFADKLKFAYQELEKSDNQNTQFEEMKKFLNYGSHKVDMEVIDTSLLVNAHSKIEEAFDLVKKINPSHYDTLEKNI